MRREAEQEEIVSWVELNWAHDSESREIHQT